MTRGHYRALAERRLATIKRLTAQLKAEKRLTNALKKLKFAPETQQRHGALLEAKRAATLRRQLMEERRAA